MTKQLWMYSTGISILQLILGECIFNLTGNLQDAFASTAFVPLGFLVAFVALKRHADDLGLSSYSARYRLFVATSCNACIAGVAGLTVLKTAKSFDAELLVALYSTIILVINSTALDGIKLSEKDGPRSLVMPITLPFFLGTVFGSLVFLGRIRAKS